jgi:hypothetical protein
MVKTVIKKLKVNKKQTWSKSYNGEQNQTKKKRNKYENWEQKNNQAFNDSYEFAQV